MKVFGGDEFTADIIGAECKVVLISVIDLLCDCADFRINSIRDGRFGNNDGICVNLDLLDGVETFLFKHIAAVGAVLIQQLCHLAGFITDGVVFIVICLDSLKLVQRPGGDIKGFVESSFAHIEQGAGIIKVQNRSPRLEIEKWIRNILFCSIC